MGSKSRSSAVQTANHVPEEMLIGYLSASEDESLTFGNDEKPLIDRLTVIKYRRPKGIHTLKEWGLLVFPDGVHKNKTFTQVYQGEKEYCHRLAVRKCTSAWAKSFQQYMLAMQNAEIKSALLSDDESGFDLCDAAVQTSTKR